MIKYHKSSVKNSHVTMSGGYKTAMPKYYKDKIFGVDNPDRKAVTEYIAERCELKRKALIFTIKKLNPTFDDDDVVNYINLCKQNKKFDKRINEVL